MLEDVIRAAKQVGLSVHFGKTKVLHNGKGQDIDKVKIEVDGQSIDILSATESTDYLGTKLCLVQGSQIEIKNRIARAWAKFATFRSELTNRKVNLYERLRLFESDVTSCALLLQLGPIGGR